MRSEAINPSFCAQKCACLLERDCDEKYFRKVRFYKLDLFGHIESFGGNVVTNEDNGFLPA